MPTPLTACTCGEPMTPHHGYRLCLRHCDTPTPCQASNCARCARRDRAHATERYSA